MIYSVIILLQLWTDILRHLTVIKSKTLNSNIFWKIIIIPISQELLQYDNNDRTHT